MDRCFSSGLVRWVCEKREWEIWSLERDFTCSVVAGSSGVNGGGSVWVVRAEDARAYLLGGGWKRRRQRRWLGLSCKSRGCTGWCSWAAEAKWESCHWRSGGGSEWERLTVKPWRILERETENSRERKWECVWSCGEEKCGDEGEEGEGFGQLQSQTLSPHVISGSGNNWKETLGRPPHSTDLISHVINSLTCEPFKPMD